MKKTTVCAIVSLIFLSTGCMAPGRVHDVRFAWDMQFAFPLTPRMEQRNPPVKGGASPMGSERAITPIAQR